MAKMKQRVIGLIGIVSRMANWNADFSGLPKTTSDGNIFGSDKALKYSMKRLWELNGEKVLYIRSYKVGKGKEGEKLQPRDLQERYQYLFEESVAKDSVTVLKRLFSCVDVMNFGATFAVEGQNIGLTGAVQIGQGFNKYEDANVEVQDILSPFRNSNEKSQGNDATSIGKKIMVDEAHYVYPFTVNPNHYDHYAGLPGLTEFEGYTTEAYAVFKEGALLGATALQTNSKSGSENAFSLFIVMKAGSLAYLPNLDPYVTVYKQDNKTVYDLSALEPILAGSREQIEQIELYLNPYTTEVRLAAEGLRRYNLITRAVL
ncbi:type I CRISPR-associated protein Cas7 [Propionispora vibrioides]|uniref:CRISPR-associated protein Csh2 n=1 Tax=Propionispora vibrioides TaxID=112903 RepID=A0A1H8VSB2_9FIRM|nr:type I CRISPR-associated protein Cas7 [Propionispora vibrioides]SEP18117.1 CRISPR-associated protein Csh2 [Propionispora vibrioides]